MASCQLPSHLCTVYRPLPSCLCTVYRPLPSCMCTVILYIDHSHPVWFTAVYTTIALPPVSLKLHRIWSSFKTIYVLYIYQVISDPIAHMRQAPLVRMGNLFITTIRNRNIPISSIPQRQKLHCTQSTRDYSKCTETDPVMCDRNIEVHVATYFKILLANTCMLCFIWQVANTTSAKRAMKQCPWG